VKAVPEHAPPSAEEVREMIQRDVARMSRAAKETELMGEDALRRSYQIARELGMLGYRAIVLRPPANEPITERALFKAHQEDAGYQRLVAMLDEGEFAALPRDDRLFLQAFWLQKLANPSLADAGYETVQKEYREVVRRTVEKKIPFTITSLDEGGRASGVAACAYLPKSNTLVIENIAIEESKKNLGVDSLLVTKAIDVANLRALENGSAGIAAIVAEAEIPSPRCSFAENQARLERLQALVNNGIYPISGFDYAREPPAEEAKEEAAPKIQAAQIPPSPAGPVQGAAFTPQIQAEEAPTPMPQEKEPVALLLCVRPVNASKEITPRQLRSIIKEMHAYYGSKVAKGLFDQLRGKAVIKIMLVDMKKLLSLGKLLGIALPPPGSEGDGDGEGREEEGGG